MILTQWGGEFYETLFDMLVCTCRMWNPIMLPVLKLPTTHQTVPRTDTPTSLHVSSFMLYVVHTHPFWHAFFVNTVDSH